MAFHETGVLGDIRLVLFEFFDLSHDLGEDVGDGLVIAATDAMQEGVAGFDVQLDGSYACAILSPVVLFFHQQVQLVQAVKHCAVLLQIIGERLA